MPTHEEQCEGGGVSCPFCWEAGFDLAGLKGHLLCDCEAFEETQAPIRFFGGGPA